jgi:hypothetical protein
MDSLEDRLVPSMPLLVSLMNKLLIKAIILISNKITSNQSEI